MMKITMWKMHMQARLARRLKDVAMALLRSAHGLDDRMAEDIVGEILNGFASAIVGDAGRLTYEGKGYEQRCRSTWRGNLIVKENGRWLYSSDRRPVSEDPDRACGHCSMGNTAEGHDGCLGVLEGVRSACCGHGSEGSAFAQFDDREDLRGLQASEFFAKARGNQ